jgi:hypothetical protein
MKMKWQHIFNILLVMLGLTSCAPSESAEDRAGIEKERLADGILRKAATQLKQEVGLRPGGTIGQMMREVQVLGLSFTYHKPIDIVEGRKLLLKAAHTLLDKINQEPRIRPYLIRYPFAPRNVEIEIFLRTPDNGFVPPDALRVITVREGVLRYKINNPKKVGFATIYKETYDEAVARLADPSLPLAAFEPDRELTAEETAKLHKSVSLVSDDGSIWHLGPNGSWIKDSKPVP